SRNYLSFTLNSHKSSMSSSSGALSGRLRTAIDKPPSKLTYRSGDVWIRETQRTHPCAYPVAHNMSPDADPAAFPLQNAWCRRLGYCNRRLPLLVEPPAGAERSA